MTQQSCAKDKYNFVLYIPEIIHQKFRVTDAGRVILDFKINPVKRLLGRLVNREPAATLELDELSSSVWLNMDGTRSILDIARMQSKKTGDDIDEAVRRIVQFMRYIVNRGWIKFKLAEHKPN
ncbi:MAG: PqqD family protein [Proteobacteria bacterium]|nr:PqqD family protein [Pseudomonadota bacterium]